MNKDYSIKSAITVGNQNLILQGIACQCGDGSRSGVTTNQKKKKKSRPPLEGKDMAGVFLRSFQRCVSQFDTSSIVQRDLL